MIFPPEFVDFTAKFFDSLFDLIFRFHMRILAKNAGKIKNQKEQGVTLLLR
jgi:hypothetical protein